MLVIGTNLPASAVTTGDFQNGSVYATITADQIRVGNALVERTWSKVPFRTLSIVDKRGGNVQWATGANDFSLTIGATDIPDDLFEVSDVNVEQIAGGLNVDIELTAPEPRWDGDPNSKFRPRFPDSTFAAVREAIFPMKLGLWMNPMHFNHNSVTFTEHPEWGCAPVGDGLILYNAAQPDSSSNEAGLATWGPDAIPHIEARIIEAITNWGVRYFKFDFLVWLDCAGQGDMYDYRDAFVAMVDRLQVAHPEVTFEVDETNDYRLFPFESVTRGPSWFQNGSPTPGHLLHNIWNLSPYVPAFSLGQHFLGGRAYNDYPVDTLMAVALTSHLTFFSDLRDIPLEIVDQAAPWVTYYQRNRSSFTNMIYPLLTDPVAGGWTALQSWDPEEGSGALLAFRQRSDEASQTIALRNVPEDRTFDLYLGVDETLVGTFTSQELTIGIPVTLGPDGAAVYLIKPHEG